MLTKMMSLKDDERESFKQFFFGCKGLWNLLDSMIYIFCYFFLLCFGS